MDEHASDNNDHTDDTMPERKLWRAVLKMAVDDLKGGGTEAQRMDACTFLFSGEYDDQLELSGFDAAWVRMGILRIALTGGGKWRNARKSIALYGERHGRFSKDCHASAKAFDRYIRAKVA